MIGPELVFLGRAPGCGGRETPPQALRAEPSCEGERHQGSSPAVRPDRSQRVGAGSLPEVSSPPLPPAGWDSVAQGTGPAPGVRGSRVRGRGVLALGA